MPRPSRARWSLRAGLSLISLVLVLAAGGSIALARARAGSARPDQTRAKQLAELRAQGSGATGAVAVGALEALEATADGTRSVPATGAAAGGVLEALDESRKTDDRPRRLLLPRRSSSAARIEGSDGWYMGMAVIAVLLAGAGGIALAARRFTPRSGAGALRVVSRVSLSPKHTVFLLQAGARVLLVGTGPQGAPTLISELDEVPVLEPAPGHGEKS